jgi:hypothetical protein
MLGVSQGKDKEVEELVLGVADGIQGRGTKNSWQKSVQTPKSLFFALRVLVVTDWPAILSAELSSARKIARCSGEVAARFSLADKSVQSGQGIRCQ